VVVKPLAAAAVAGVQVCTGVFAVPIGLVAQVVVT
jgi:hypothetical protein